VKLVARVLAADGSPLAKALAEVVIPTKGSERVVVAQGGVDQGSLGVELPGDVGMAWGLRIDGAPVHVAVAYADPDVIDLGEIRLLARPVALAAFHAPEGTVYGLPAQLAGGTGAPAEGATLEPTRMTFGDLFGSTARQLGNVVADPSSGLALTAASITLKGVPTASNDAVGLEFPGLDAIGSGAALSELSFSLRPRAVSGDIGVPGGPAAPGLVGYTRDLALRKVAAAGLVAEVSHEIVADAARVGRVTRQVPAAGAYVAPGEVVRLFIGKNDQP
jgi:hypothetical protein